MRSKQRSHNQGDEAVVKINNEAIVKETTKPSSMQGSHRQGDDAMEADQREATSATHCQYLPRMESVNMSNQYLRHKRSADNLFTS